MLFRLICFFRYLLNDNIKIGRHCIVPISGRFITKGSGSIIVGNGFHSMRNTTIQSDYGRIEISNNVFVNEGCMIVSHKSISIGASVKIGPYTCIYDHDHNYKKDNNEPYLAKDIKIGMNTWIGAHCIILSGTTIGENCVIAAGTVIKGDIPDNVLVYNKRENKLILIEKE